MTTISDRARALAIQVEVKKDKMSQRQSGEWAITFVLHPQEMPAELMNAKPGTRYTIALVETGDDGEPVERPNPSKERKVRPPDQSQDSTLERRNDSPPRSVDRHPKPVGAEKTKRDWREMQPAAQAAVIGSDSTFWLFVQERHGYDWTAPTNETEAAQFIRDFCCISSRKDLATNHKARVIFNQLVADYRAWQREPEVVG